MKKSLRIHSNGYGGDETVIVDEDGQTVQNVTRAVIEINVGAYNEITLDIVGSETVVEGRVISIQFNCPCCDFVFDHECDTDLGGTHPPPKPISPPKTPSPGSPFGTPTPGGVRSGLYTTITVPGTGTVLPSAPPPITIAYPHKLP